jgi:hypothetical protein
MSRFDPLGERQDLLDAIEAKRENQVEPPEPERDGDRSRSSGPSEAVRLVPGSPPPDLRFKDARRVFYECNRGYRLRESEIRTLVELGKFRVVGASDLAVHAYDGHLDEMREDLRSLVRQGLIRKGVFEGPEHNPLALITLTKHGYRLLRANHVAPKDQALFYGFVRASDANHDAHLYKLYQKEIARIEKDGGHNPRVILDVELRQKVNRDLAKFGVNARPEIAKRHGLRVVRERIALPDVRIEYEKSDGEMARIDLELITEHYNGHSLRDKVMAGFSLYTPRGEADRLRRILEGRELTAEILSL